MFDKIEQVVDKERFDEEFAQCFQDFNVLFGKNSCKSNMREGYVFVQMEQPNKTMMTRVRIVISWLMT